MYFGNARFGSTAFIASALCLFVIAQNSSSGRGFDKSRMDETASACADFYQFANGAWLKQTSIPAAFPSWGSFDILAENNNETLHTILEDAAKNKSSKPGSTEQKIGDFYSSCMDQSKRDAEGVQPLSPYFDSVRKVDNVKSLASEIGYLQRNGISAPFGFGSGPDLKNSSMNIANAVQRGLSLPNRDYYTKTDEKSAKLREELVNHIISMFELLGDKHEIAVGRARTVMAIETRLARNSRGPAELRDPSTQYHIMGPQDLAKLTPHFAWNDFLSQLGLPATLNINIAHPEFFSAVDKMLTDISFEDWKIYLTWHILNSAASALSSNFETENFNFYGKTLQGRKEQYPLWRRCVAATDSNLGEALGQKYVERAFTPEAKLRMKTMIDNLIAAFRDRISSLDWMTKETRDQALAKLAAFKQKIGYPDKWIDYSKLSVSRDSYAANLIRSNEFDELRDLNKIGKPVDKTEWGMTPPTVNAYNNPVRNEIVFPAGILQPPFFNSEADDAINYGSIGAVIGHEITHGFDDQGAKFDLEGNVKDWWAAADLKNFHERSDCVVKQFDAYEVEPGLHEIGKLVSGESIADLGGLTVAYQAFLKSMAGKPRPANIDGFTPEQRFFLGWAQVWAEKSTPEYERLIAQSNPHPISRFRVNGPMSNIPEFASAFQCKPGDPMVRPSEQRCQVW